MNEIYRDLRRVLSDAASDHLRESQCEWLAFRDREMVALDTDTQGSLFLPMHASDRLRLIRDRARQLPAWLDTWRLRDQHVAASSPPLSNMPPTAQCDFAAQKPAR